MDNRTAAPAPKDACATMMTARAAIRTPIAAATTKSGAVSLVTIRARDDAVGWLRVAAGAILAATIAMTAAPIPAICVDTSAIGGRKAAGGGFGRCYTKHAEKDEEPSGTRLLLHEAYASEH